MFSMGLVVQFLLATVFQIYIAFSDYPPFFKPDLLICMSSNFNAENDINGTLTSIFSIIIIAGPVIFMTILNATTAIMIHLTKASVGRAIPGRTLVALGGVTWVFVLSFSFVIGHLVLEQLIGHPVWFELTMMHLMGLNVVCNPLIYLFTSREPRKFLRDALTLGRYERSGNEVNSPAPRTHTSDA